MTSQPDSANMAERKAPDKWKRAANVKSKSGCITCKTRHVKCDEGKPYCQRCLKLGENCLGYRVGQTERRRQFILAPKVVSSEDQTLWPSKPGQLKILHWPGNKDSVQNGGLRELTLHDQLTFSSPTLQVFENDKQSWYYQLFCDKTTTRLGGFFDERLWSMVVRQECEREPVVRDAAIGLGALDAVMNARSSASNREVNSAHHLVALKQYGKTIKGIRQLLAEKNLRGVLIASILCIAFSGYQGDTNAAVSHASSMLNLIKEWSDVSDTYWQTKLDLESICVQLDIQNVSTANMEPVVMAPFLETQIDRVIQQMPKEFSNVQEASSFWELITRRWFIAYHSIKSFMSSLKVKDVASFDTFNYQTVGSEELEQMISKLMFYGGMLEDWSSAFQPLCAQCRKKNIDFMAADLLDIRHRAGQIRIKFTLGNGRCNNENHRECEEIVGLCEPLILDQKDHVGFTLNNPLIQSLYYVGLGCQDVILQQRIILLLRSTPWRVGIWDSIATAKVLKLAMDLEKLSRLGGSITESSRLRDITTRFDFQQRKGDMWFTRGDRLLIEKVSFCW